MRGETDVSAAKCVYLGFTKTVKRNPVEKSCDSSSAGIERSGDYHAERVKEKERGEMSRNPKVLLVHYTIRAVCQRRHEKKNRRSCFIASPLIERKGLGGIREISSRKGGS